ncbi:MAG: UPF0280 family protein [Candidatus Omnitrophota bacterium]|jgi:ApbE superfamily uncharacterized protein (UPF0280 family)
MKTGRYKKNFYRGWVKAEDLRLTQIIDKDMELQILTNKKTDEVFIRKKMWQYRMDIENYIERDRAFLVSLKPIMAAKDAPLIIKNIAQESKKANTTAMSAVAGAIAESLGHELLEAGFKDVVVENAGSIFLKTTRSIGIGIYAGKAKLWNKLKLKIKPKDTPLGIATFSGTLTQSLNFGCADSVIVLSKSTLLASSVATAVANRVNSKEDLQKALDFAKDIKGVIAVIIVLKNNLVSWGKVEFIK